MKKNRLPAPIIPIFAATTMLLSACAASSAPGPVSVSRFHAPDQIAQIGSGTVFVETAPGVEFDPAELSVFKGAVARELTRLGYTEAPREQADNIALVRVDRYVTEPAQARRGPVSVGLGGSTGSYGSGLGLGIGINLGGGGSSNKIGTELGVMLRDKQSNETYWEGRAEFQVSEKSALAGSAANADAISQALFQGFPGQNGETIEVKVSE